MLTLPIDHKLTDLFNLLMTFIFLCCGYHLSLPLASATGLIGLIRLG